MSFSPDGGVIAGFSDGALQFWNGKTGQSIGQIRDQQVLDKGVLAVDFSSDGKFVYLADIYGSLKIWDMELHGPPMDSSITPVQTSGTTKVVRVSFADGTANTLPRRVLENNDESASTNDSSASHPVFSDGMGETAISDWSYMDDDGWMRNRRASGTKPEKNDPILFWLPPANRPKFWWPRNIVVMDPGEEHPVTRIDFSHFMHGVNWQRCRESRPKDSK